MARQRLASKLSPYMPLLNMRWLSCWPQSNQRSQCLNPLSSHECDTCATLTQHERAGKQLLRSAGKTSPSGRCQDDPQASMTYRDEIEGVHRTRRLNPSEIHAQPIPSKERGHKTALLLPYMARCGRSRASFRWGDSCGWGVLLSRGTSQEVPKSPAEFGRHVHASAIFRRKKNIKEK